MSTKPNVTIEVITPAMAKEWLEKNNKNNRRISPNRVKALVKTMKNEKFILSPDAIAFDGNGRLTNGQHRLTACIEANEPIECMVLRNVVKESFMVTDIGLQKRGQHALETSGYVSAQLLAGVCRMVHCAEETGVKWAWHGGIRSVTPNEIVDIAQRYPKLVEICNKSKELSGREKINCPASVIAYALWVSHEAKQYHEMLDFLTRVSLGAGLTVMSPELALQRRLNKFDGFHGRTVNNEQCALILKAFIAKQKKEKVERLQWQEKEAFPTLTEAA